MKVMNALPAVSRTCCTPRARFLRIRRTLWQEGVLQIQFVYCALAEVPYVTLTATPREPGNVINISARVKERLGRAFTQWMSQTQPDWHVGPDCAGVLSWELTDNRFTHHHCGYTLSFFAQRRETQSIMPDKSVSPRPNTGACT
jgi:hypothetical protein